MVNKNIGNTNNPLVSVIIPVYNCEKYLEDAVSSIINQTYHNLEVIIVDDGSSDNSYQIMKKIANIDDRIKIYQNPKNIKIVKTLNFAIEKSVGKYISRMDGDDIKLPYAIKKQVEFMEKNPDVIALGGCIDVCDENMNIMNHRDFPLDDLSIKRALFRYNPIAHPTVMMRKSAIGNDPYITDWIEDYELWFRLGSIGKLANLSDTLLKLRVHSKSVSRSKASRQENLMMYVRLKAVFEYGYKMSMSDKIYFILQILSKWIMPTKLRFWLYNKIRSIYS